jgi:predicted AlkP superfamily pyrophosphatase or phosphodiesterase
MFEKTIPSSEKTSRRLCRAALWLVAVTVLMGCTETQPDRPSSAQQETDAPRHVVLISIDGVPAEYLWNEEIPLPTIRGLADDGVWAEAMVPSTPTKTWANHTTMVTGVHPSTHRVFTNGLFTEVAGPRVVYRNDLDRDELSTQPTVYDRAYEAGLRTAGINWPVTRNAETLHDNFPDGPKKWSHTTPQLRAELIDQGLLADSADVDYPFASPTQADYTWTSAATHLIESRTPDLLLFHLLNVDTMHHRHEAFSWSGYTAMAYADAQVQRILNALDAAGIRDQTAIFVVSDHGFTSASATVRPNVLLRKAGLLEANADGAVEQARVQIVQNGGSAMVFATEQAEPGDLERARSVLEDAEGIAEVVGPEDYDEYDLPPPSEEPRVGDLFLDAAPGHEFGNAATGDHLVLLDQPIGKHGYSNKPSEMNTLFVASGDGIRSSDTLETVDIRSVAPTAARLLGLDFEAAEGDVLESILE